MILPLIIGLVFAPIAACMAFVITYEEYCHHFADRRVPLRRAIEAAAAAGAVVLSIALVAGALLQRGMLSEGALPQ